MSNMKDLLKQKVRTSPSSVHNQLIDQAKADTSEDINVNHNVNVNVNVDIPQKPKFEDKYSRATVFIQNDLLHLLEKLSKRGKGEKTRIMNEALREWMKSNGLLS